jgi:hypothetical protein
VSGETTEKKPIDGSIVPVAVVPPIWTEREDPACTIVISVGTPWKGGFTKTTSISQSPLRSTLACAGRTPASIAPRRSPRPTDSRRLVAGRVAMAKSRPHLLTDPTWR